jgi:hypothetical protein
MRIVDFSAFPPIRPPGTFPVFTGKEVFLPSPRRRGRDGDGGMISAEGGIWVIDSVNV